MLIGSQSSRKGRQEVMGGDGKGRRHADFAFGETEAGWADDGRPRDDEC